MTKKKNFIEQQRTQEVRGPNGAYEQWGNTHPTKRLKGKLGDRFDYVSEDVRANPDSLREDEGVCMSGKPSTPRFLMGEAVQHLQGRQKEVYLMTMRDGRSLLETANILKISKSSAQKYKERAIKFLTAYCQEAIARGRV